MRVLLPGEGPLPDSRRVRECTYGTVTEIGDFRLVVRHYVILPTPWPPVDVGGVV
jgi:hypothetical protein